MSASLVPSAVAPRTAEDGLGLTALLDLLGLDPATDAAAVAPLPDRDLSDLFGRVRTLLRRAADWGSGPQRSWCAW